MTSFSAITATTPAASPALVRFTVAGLTATIDAHLAGTLPLHRFAWELCTRIDTLGRLDAPARVVTRLRWLHRTVERLHAELTETGGEGLDAAQQDALTAALADLRTVLATLTPPTPRDPAGAGRPAATATVATTPTATTATATTTTATTTTPTTTTPTTTTPTTTTATTALITAIQAPAVRTGAVAAMAA